MDAERGRDLVRLRVGLDVIAEFEPALGGLEMEAVR